MLEKLSFIILLYTQIYVYDYLLLLTQYFQERSYSIKIVESIKNRFFEHFHILIDVKITKI